MLLRTVILLLLCISVGMCATLGSYQTATAEGSHTVNVATDEASAPELSSNFGSPSQTTDTNSVDTATADEAEVDISAADGAGTDKDSSSGHASTLQTVTAEAASPKPPFPVKEGNDISPVQMPSGSRALAQEESAWSLSSIRKRFQTVHGYFDSLVELAGGQNGVCQYRCRYGKSPFLESASGSWQSRREKENNI